MLHMLLASWLTMVPLPKSDKLMPGIGWTPRHWTLLAIGLAICGMAVLPGSSQVVARQGTIEGRASVIDGDTVEVHGTYIRIHGIDAPESNQTCVMHDGTIWRCGKASTDALAEMVGTQPVSCEVRDIDKYGRKVAVCHAKGIDVGASLVAAGLAVAYRKYSMDYAHLEDKARAARHGVWAARQFEMPWDFRRNRKQ
jgi:endonuclease YncB( thermonuclease family)